jgi:hypothetical protein
MTFPNGKLKEGYFENNIYIGPYPSSEPEVSIERPERKIDKKY